MIAGIILEIGLTIRAIMIDKSSIPEKPSEDKDWAGPSDPENVGDCRDEEQFSRQVEEAKRRKENLTEKDHIDKPKKTDKDDN